jgi:hypothetical protein
MLIGDSVTHDGRTYVVVGFTPVSVTPAEVELRDTDTGVSVWVEMSLVVQPEAPERAALRVVPSRSARGQR